MKKLMGLILLFLIILGFFVYIGKNEQAKPKTGSIKKISLRGREFTLEIAQTSAEREKGLSGRKELCPNCGLLFLFTEKGKRSFWMKNMNFNLDIIWIADQKVVALEKNVPYAKGELEIRSPDVLADKVLEINAGLCDELGIKEGDKIEF